MAGIYNFTDGLKLLSTGFIQGDKFDLIKVEHLEQSLKFLENFRNRRGVSEARANLFIIILDKHYLDEYLNLESRNFKKFKTNACVVTYQKKYRSIASHCGEVRWKIAVYQADFKRQSKP